MSFDKECFYCVKDQRLTDIMIEICELEASILYLFKEQTYRGRCLIAFKGHKSEMFELTEEERNSFAKDIATVGQALHNAFLPKKVNYGAFADNMKHLHFHIVPKYEGGPDYGGTFTMNPQKTYLSDEEYKELIYKIKNNL
ncbi:MULTISPECIES: HIT family protein [Clostridium]|uniref:HIT family protein n=1 Tax=Clostridium cibarium TaxID=2762247 RepID=A0ABR8PX76_9CLOT|nr:MULTISPECIES: HIT family protein [Clostridium]MBD7912753.1 HIT family protein [Clostridium cibarium]